MARNRRRGLLSANGLNRYDRMQWENVVGIYPAVTFHFRYPIPSSPAFPRERSTYLDIIPASRLRELYASDRTKPIPIVYYLPAFLL